MEEDQITLDEQQIEAPIWGKLENFLSGCLAFTILISVPIIIACLSLDFHKEEELSIPVKTQEEIRQEALEDNWDQFLDRADAAGNQIQLENFELTLCPFSSSETWHHTKEPEEAGFICGYVTVPLDHLQPTGETIQIPIAIKPSFEEGTQPDPLVITHGGPGGSILEYAPSHLYTERIGAKRDLVFIDQRGTRYAKPNLICPEITELVYGPLNPEDEHEYDYPEYLKYCRARLAGKGITLSAFTTPQIARDFEIVRQSFGYERINFYGVSYGTHVGQYLAEYYPDNIRSLILDGVAPIPLDYLNRSVSTRTRILDEIFISCDKDPICSENYPDLSARLSAVVNRLDQNPEQVRLGFDYRFYPLELDGEFFFNYLLSIAYMDQNYALLPYIIKEAENNRFDYFKAWVDWRMSDLIDRSLAYYVVICSEHQPFMQINQDTLNLDIPLISWENSDLEELENICLSLGIQHAPDTLEVLQESTIPTLLLSGYFDPVTPPEYGEMTLDSFSNGEHIIDPLGSHGIVFSDDCPKFVMYQFLENPYKDIDSACLDDPDRREEVVPPTALSVFFLKDDISFIFTITPLLIIILILLRYGIKGMMWIWRRIRKIKLSPNSIKKRLNRRFELSNWVFVLSSLGFGFGFYLTFDTHSSRSSIFRFALALPENARLYLIIPFMLVVLTPVVIYFTIRIWKYYSSVLARLYLLIHTLLCLLIPGTILLNDMLLVWTR